MSSPGLGLLSRHERLLWMVDTASEAWRLFYAGDALPALKQSDKLLSQDPRNVDAWLCKNAALEKLYYGHYEWHNDLALENAREALDRAAQAALETARASELRARVFFRRAISACNAKDYELAWHHFRDAKTLGCSDPALPAWNMKVRAKLERQARKKNTTLAELLDSLEKQHKALDSSIDSSSSYSQTLHQPPIVPASKQPTGPAQANPPKTDLAQDTKTRMDWYQGPKSVTITWFTTNPPVSPESCQIVIEGKSLTVEYKIGSGSEFQYSLKLYGHVDSSDYKVRVFSKKFEIQLTKAQNENWKTLEATPDGNSTEKALQYPTSSKKNIDWSRLNLDVEDEDEGSADAFFQKLYKDADPDTKRAMMKSYIESNGTALNTNWEDVAKAPVKTSPPTGMEEKKW